MTVSRDEEDLLPAAPASRRRRPGWSPPMLPLIATLLVLVAAFPASGGEGAGKARGKSAAVAASPGRSRVSERLLGLPGLANVGRVAPGVFRGSQPRPGGYATLKGMGIRTVVNLRSRHGEREAVEALGMRYVEVPMKAYADVTREAVEKVVAIMRDPESRPVFVHCAHGKDRTGVVVAVYRMTVDGWSAAEAEEEMQAFGFNDLWRHLREFVRRYAAAGGDGG